MPTRRFILGLVVAGAAGLSLQFPIAAAITALLVIVALSYAQTIRGYPSGGGSYVVARENLGTMRAWLRPVRSCSTTCSPPRSA